MGVTLNRCVGFLLLEEIFYSLVGNHALVEDVSTGLGALDHLNNLSICATIRRTFVEGSDRFFCHSMLLFYLLMKSHLLKDRVIFLKFHALRSVLAILGSHVATCTGQTAFLHLRAF